MKAADKLHNLQCLLADLRSTDDPARVWKQFKGGRERTLRMSVSLVAALEPRVDQRLSRALRATLLELTELAQRDGDGVA